MTSEKSVDELLAELKTLRAKTIFGADTAIAWVKENNFTAGKALSLPGSELYWHYKNWCRRSGLTVGYFPMVFRALKKAGFRSRRVYESGKQVRRYMTDEPSAIYLRAWIKANPCPATELISHVRKPKWMKEAEAAGVVSE